VKLIFNGFVDELHLLGRVGEYSSTLSFEKVAKPILWMGRSELRKERRKLQEDYFKSSLPSVVAKGGLIGAVIGGAPIAIAVKRAQKPALQKILRRAAIPVVALGTAVGAISAPGRHRRSVTSRLFEVDSRLRATSTTSLRKRMRKTASPDSGHWRKLPAHWEGDDKQGNPIKGRTWVDTKPRESKKGPPVPAPELFGREGKFSVYLAPTPNGALVFGVHDDIDEQFSKLVIQGGEDWAYDESVHKFMTKHEKSGKFSIYLVG